MDAYIGLTKFIYLVTTNATSLVGLNVHLLLLNRALIVTYVHIVLLSLRWKHHRSRTIIEIPVFIVPFKIFSYHSQILHSFFMRISNLRLHNER